MEGDQATVTIPRGGMLVTTFNKQRLIGQPSQN